MMETGRRITVLDGWRGLSVALVLIGHFFPNPIANLGTWGVEWFFVLSGRLMADILFVRRAPLGEFYRRRLSRILPVVLVFVPVAFIAFHNTEWHFKPMAIIAALTFTLNYASVLQGHQVPVIAHIWSLCVEEHTYITLGLLAFMARRFGWRVLPTLCGGAALSVLDLIICSAFPHKNFFDVSWRTDAHIYSILFGAIAYMALRDRSLPKWISSGAIVAAILVLLTNHFVHQEAMSVLSTAALAVAMARLERSSGPILDVMNFAALRRLGVLSFSIYMWQQPFYVISETFNPELRGLMLLAAMTLGVSSFYLIEQPARRWLNGLNFKPAVEPQSSVRMGITDQEQPEHC